MKNLIIFLAVVVITTVAIYFIVFNVLAPSNVYKATPQECNTLGIGSIGMCYGNLAVNNNDISLCNSLENEQERSNCFVFYNNHK